MKPNERPMTDSPVGVTECTAKIRLKSHVTKLVRDPSFPLDT